MCRSPWIVGSLLLRSVKAVSYWLGLESIVSSVVFQLMTSDPAAFSFSSLWTDKIFSVLSSGRSSPRPSSPSLPTTSRLLLTTRPPTTWSTSSRATSEASTSSTSSASSDAILKVAPRCRIVDCKKNNFSKNQSLSKFVFTQKSILFIRFKNFDFILIFIFWSNYEV